MNKLLHERLREVEGNDYENQFQFEDGYRIWIPEEEAERLADEIERYYIPRPRFEDGEPIKLGDKLYYSDEKEATVEWYTVSSDGTYDIGVDQVSQYDGFLDEPLKRPKPKVLDVYGVEIKEGDTVWHIEGSSPWQVESADIRGVKVFGNNIANISGSTVFHPSHLTHKEPDSLEKIEKDATTNPHVYCREHFDFDGSEDLEEVVSRFAVDLLERQRKVLYRSE